MQVFKVYFKIIRANLNQMSIYLVIFLSMSIAFSISGNKKSEENFNQLKVKVAFINQGEDTLLTKSFKEYLTKYADFVEIENNEKDLQDALFFRDVEYIVNIPKNFTEEFLKGRAVEVEKTIVPDSTSGMYMDMAINKYFNTARIYVDNVPGIKEEELVKKVSSLGTSEVGIKIKNFEDEKQSNYKVVNYFNYLAYPMLAMFILGISSNLMVLNNKNIKRRNLCSPMKDRSYNLQLIASNMAFGFILYVFMLILAFILNKKSMMGYNGFLLSVNALIFTIAALSISYLAGSLINNKSIQSAVANVLALGLSFISGVFVPQEFLSTKATTIASFTPTYWYVKANNVIGSLTNFNSDELSSIFTYMLIEIGFAVAIFSIALVISKQKRISNS
jgi:ABC-2 type transport system permease protein